jgi:hypothetical protein
MRKIELSLVGLGILFALAALFLSAAASPAAAISGVIQDEYGPVAGATVRIQATTNNTLSAADGSFTLGGLPDGIPLTVSAWKEGYYCAKVETVTPPASGITLTLYRYQTNDNPDYEWMLPTGANSCFSCKTTVTQIWMDNDAHRTSGANPRFLSLYNGTDLSGAETVSPGFKMDFPGTAGNCASCHAPGAALDAPFSTDMNLLSGIDRDFGIHCDFCHKVADVYLNPATGLPYENAPGVISMDIRRPFTDMQPGQLFFGTFDDTNAPEVETYLPLIGKSQWCAPCHQFSFWGTPVYQSFKEWLDSPYPALGVECQTCHMPPDGVTTNVAEGFGGVERDPLTIHAHTMPGAANLALLQETVSLVATADVSLDRVLVNVTLTNTGAGHHVPTDNPGRQMILTVSAVGGDGKLLPRLSGGSVPAWGGPQAGQAGKAYAKILQDAASGELPVVSYWKQTFIVSDNRLPALGSDTTAYAFQAPPGGGMVQVSVELRFRRNFWDLMQAKNWEEADILMENWQGELTSQPWSRVYFPLLVR